MTTKVRLVEDFLPSRTVCEEVDGKKKWFIEGIFLQADVVNKNKRVYPEKVLDAAVNKFEQEYLTKNRAIGELNHPDSIAVSLERISHKIVSIRKEGADYYGRAEVLNTPTGKVLQSLLEGGVKVGVSSRGFGSTKSTRSGHEEVNGDYNIVAIDAVFHPSAPGALVTGLMESADPWDRKNEDVMFLESIRNEVTQTNNNILEEQQLNAFKKFMELIKK